ncbi:MAG: tetratricopeptide repeat protein [Cyanobacteria bacterium P01_A01_bin.114]
MPAAWAEPLHSPRDKVAIQQGVAAFEQADYQQAISAFSRAVEFNPSSAVAYSNRCLTYLQLGQPTAAVSDCTQGLRLNPDMAEPYLNRGLAYYRLGQYGDAIADYQRLIDRHPDDHRAYYNLGLAQSALGNHTAALEIYGIALHHTVASNAPAEAKIYNDRGVAYLHLERYKAALADFTQALALDTDVNNSVRAYFNRACCYQHLKEYLLAIQDLSRVLSATPDDARTYLARGVVHHQLGDRWAAIADWREAAHYFQTHHELAAYQATLELIETLQRASPETPETMVLAI